MTVDTPVPESRPRSGQESEVYDAILQSTARLARLSFAAAASSVFLLDPELGELVFEACSGVGEDQLIGVAIPQDRGIAGWVAQTGETIIVRNTDEDQRFDRGFAAQTGLVPEVILAAPLEHQGEILGVLEVLDPALDTVGELTAIDMLTELANQSALAVSLLAVSRRAVAGANPADRLGAMLNGVGATGTAAVNNLLAALADVLSTQR